jgi:spermidine synthase
MATLITELSLIRVFDVLFHPNVAYIIITTALFGFGIAGVYSTLKPPPKDGEVKVTLSKLAAMSSIVALAILPILNWLPTNFEQLSTDRVSQLIYFGSIYVLLLTPFFFAGLGFATIFSGFPNQIQFLYFSDLLGAAIGSIIVIPFITLIGPGGLLIFAAGLSLFASGLFSGTKRWAITCLLSGLVMIAVPLINSPRYFDFAEHQNKRGVRTAREQGRIETTVWDPVSKIDVINQRTQLHIAYDGGSQSSAFYPFDGDFLSLRDNIATNLDKNFPQRAVLASHYLMRGSEQSVLVIGSAGGQEIKAALLYGARKVDGIEMVEAVVDLGKNKYAAYIGNLFNHQRVNVVAGEGRSYLRATDEKYDIIQIYSNHTSSSIAAGRSAFAPVYLNTTEAFLEYFGHLRDDGILHINHHEYPRMVTTAAQAWYQSGRDNFQKHVVVFRRYEGDTLPTFLVKMQPWTQDELNDIRSFFVAGFPGDSNEYTLVENPLAPEESLLTPEYYLEEIPDMLVERSRVRITPTTDNRPYFNFLRKSLVLSSEELLLFVKGSLGRIPLAVGTLYIVGAVSLFYGIIFILTPLIFADVGKQRWQSKTKSLVYFSCLGAGFIIIELVLIQIFMRLIGSPLHTYTIVIFVILFGAGIGSLASRSLNISPAGRWYLPFVGILAIGLFILAFYPYVFQFVLGSALSVRIAIATILIFPLGFFLGMPFPLGILALETGPKGAIAWAWGMNGLFTVVGSLIAITFSIQYGFISALLIAFFFYLIALFMFSGIRSKA